MLPKYFGEDFATGPLATILRYVICIQLCEVGVIGIRVIFMTSAITSWYQIEILKVLSNVLPSKKYLTLYRENAVVSKLIFDYNRTVTTFGLSALFFGLIIGVNLILYAAQRQEYALVIISLVFTTAAYIMLHTFFLFGCNIYTVSGRILFRWKTMQNIFYTKTEFRETRMVLRSMKVICMPAGDAGIIDRDIKMNYMEKLLESLVDTIITRNTLMT